MAPPAGFRCPLPVVDLNGARNAHQAAIAGFLGYLPEELGAVAVLLTQGLVRGQWCPYT